MPELRVHASGLGGRADRSRFALPSCRELAAPPRQPSKPPALEHLALPNRTIRPIPCATSALTRPATVDRENLDITTAQRGGQTLTRITRIELDGRELGPLAIRLCSHVEPIAQPPTAERDIRPLPAHA